ncbi:MAG: DUF3990 domain-containing protein [Dysgonamonadaceae bacterium]|jgi:hypothetical protein|nr:DUF3990 domain-containing protein [Dysgonamonadaceae bacterium]
MKVYHGSYLKIEKIDFHKCRPFRDFGKGFYVTNILSQAEYWAERKGRIANSAGVVTEFEFIGAAFTHWGFNVLRFSSYTEEWLDFVVKNRNTGEPFTHGYDLVEGPVADDDIAQRINGYLFGLLSKNNFLHELKFRQPSHQICLCTHRSLQALKFENEKVSLLVAGISTPLIRQLMSDNHINEDEASELFFQSETYKHLSDSNNNLYLLPWQEIYRLFRNEAGR